MSDPNKFNRRTNLEYDEYDDFEDDDHDFDNENDNFEENECDPDPTLYDFGVHED